jgi:hypothetical protein
LAASALNGVSNGARLGLDALAWAIATDRQISNRAAENFLLQGLSIWLSRNHAILQIAISARNLITVVKRIICSKHAL